MPGHSEIYEQLMSHSASRACALDLPKHARELEHGQPTFQFYKLFGRLSKCRDLSAFFAIGFVAVECDSILRLCGANPRVRVQLPPCAHLTPVSLSILVPYLEIGHRACTLTKKRPSTVALAGVGDLSSKL